MAELEDMRAKYAKKEMPKLGSLYICEVQGSDSDGIGSEKMPFLTLQKAIQVAKGEAASYEIFFRKAILDPYEPASKAGIKKAVKAYELSLKKAQKDAEKAESDKLNALKNAEHEQKRLEEAKLVVLEEDKSLPK